MLLTALALTLATPALADDGDNTAEVEVIDLRDSPHGFGIGVVLGAPTGVSVAVRTGPYRAFQAHLSWSLVHDRARVSADYLQSLAILRPSEVPLDFPLYLGLGGTVGVGGPPWDPPPPWVGARVPFGLAMLPHDVPVEVFGEVAPVAYLLPETALGLEGALGVRAYF